MRVLSLFDGISCGQLALHRAMLPISTYYASEVNFFAKTVTQFHFPNTIQLGSVKPLPVDLVLGGSPCQGFSLAGKRLNLADPRSKLIEHYFALVEQIKPKYFLLENVPMDKTVQDYISNRLGVEPLKLNSSRVSAQSRKRLYWTNIPVTRIKPKFQYFNKWLFVRGHGWLESEIKFWVKSPTVTTSFHNSYFFVTNPSISLQSWKQHVKQIPITDCERLQTLPTNYTFLAPLAERYKMVGNCWTVDLVAELLKGIKI